jgi:hypothetical protein
MGIDIYMRWENQSQDDKEKQYTGYSIEAGHVGYLREASHGSPYATKHLLHEAFEAEDGEAYIPCETLRDRLQDTLKLHIRRCKDIYGEDVKFTDPSAKAFTDFVELAERKTAEGYHPRFTASY